MWRDIALANRTALLSELDAYMAKLSQIRELLDQGDGSSLEKIFGGAQAARQAWIAAIEAAEQARSFEQGGD
jgi:prephenate dehydrogenase